MSPRRRLFVWLLLLWLVSGYAIAAVREKEMWPFSHYAMYSWVHKDPVYKQYQLIGVTDEERSREMRLRTEFLRPLGEWEVVFLIRKFLREKKPDQLNELVAETAERYESRRAALDAPPLRALRLYNVSFRLDPRSGNFDAPESRELLVEHVVPR